MEEYKIKYNNLIKRYFNGCEYLEAHPDEIDKYLPNLIEIQKCIEELIKKYDIKDENIIDGFKN